MPPVGFEPTIPAGERPQTYALDGAATGTGTLDRGGKFHPLPGCDPRTAQPIASSYTDCDTSAHVLFKEGRGQTLFRGEYEK